ncbi:MAG: VOC family protein [Desulfobacteraceae bacterium]|nr:VOC family protein [Desulfobacteraceae bacterium]
MIHAIQHIGIGVLDHEKMWQFYRDVLGFDVPAAKAHSYAERMHVLTEGVQKRKVVIALNLMGGAMVELFKFTSKPVRPQPDIVWGDTGILSCFLKVMDIDKAYKTFKDNGVEIVVEPGPMTPAESMGWRQMIIRDPEGNLLSPTWTPDMKYALKPKGSNIGGISGVTIGVSDMEKSLEFYKNVLGYSHVLFDWEGTDSRLSKIPGAEKKMRRVLLSKPGGSTSFFKFYFNAGVIELVEVYGHKPTQTFAGRGWGDQGMMEICFDVDNIENIFEKSIQKGALSVVKPNTEVFTIGNDVAAYFSYIYDPDKLFVEFAETTQFKVFPGFRYDLRKRKANKPLPSFLLKLSRFRREKPEVI